MDTKVFCVYNLARGVFLSSKVTVADCANEPLKMLKVLVSGLGLDAVSGLWLSPLYTAPAVPRLFPFDILYLDRDQQVVDAAEILPGAEFPLFRQEVASALVLAHQTLQTTQTAPGDRLIIGLEEEIEGQIAALDIPSTKQLKPSGNGHRESKAVRAEAPLSRSQSPVLSSQFSSAATAVPESGIRKGQALTALSREGEIRAADSRDSAKVESVNLAASVVAGPSGVAKASPVAKESLKALGEKLAQSDIPEIAAKSPIEEDKSPTPAETPVISITEVVLETPRSAQATPVIIGQQGGVEDLFSNWVDAPSSASVWIARNAVPQGAIDTSAPASVAPLFPAPKTAKASEPSSPAASRAVFEPVKVGQQSVAVVSVTAAPANNLAPVSLPPTQIAIPQAPLATTFTVAQYGLWRVSMPTGVSPVVAVQGPLASRPESSAAPLAATAADDVKKKKTVPQSKETSSTVAAMVDSPAITLAPEEPKVAMGQGSMLAAADIKPLVDVIKSAVERLPGKVAGTAVAPQAAKAAVVVPDTVAIPPREVPEDETEISAPGTEGFEKKPFDSKAIVSAKTAASNQADNKKELASTLHDDPAVTLPLPGIRKPAEKGKVKIPIQRVDGNGKTKQPPPPSLGMRFKRWLNPVAPTNSDRRKAHRRYVPGMIAHYFTGGAPRPYDVADISMTGFYLLTQDRWMPGTMIQMTLQKPCARGERKQSITILSKVVRRGSDGVAAEFVMPESLDPRSHDVQPTQATDRFALARFI